MRIKEVCRQTRLTERAVRLYIKEGLLDPGQHNGIMDFTPEDVKRLEQLALLRKADFSLMEIHRLLQGEAPCDLLKAKICSLHGRAEHDQALADLLAPLAQQTDSTLDDLIHCLKAASVPALRHFSPFDEPVPTEADIQQALMKAQFEQSRKSRKNLVLLLVAAILILGLIGLYFSLSRSAPTPPPAYQQQLQTTLQEILSQRKDPSLP